MLIACLAKNEKTFKVRKSTLEILEVVKMSMTRGKNKC